MQGVPNDKFPVKDSPRLVDQLEKKTKKKTN